MVEVTPPDPQQPPAPQERPETPPPPVPTRPDPEPATLPEPPEPEPVTTAISEPEPPEPRLAPIPVPRSKAVPQPPKKPKSVARTRPTKPKAVHPPKPIPRPESTPPVSASTAPKVPPIGSSVAPKASTRRDQATVAAPPAEAIFGSDDGPKFNRRVRTRYPRAAIRARIAGTVVLRLTIDSRGRLNEIEVVTSAGQDLDEAAIRAVRASTFHPALRDGLPVASRAILPIRFKLKE